MIKQTTFTYSADIVDDLRWHGVDVGAEMRAVMISEISQLVSGCAILSVSEPTRTIYENSFSPMLQVKIEYDTELKVSDEENVARIFDELIMNEI